MKKAYRSLISAALLLGCAALYSCGSESQTTKTTDPAENTEAVTEEKSIFESVGVKDFGGREFRLLLRDTTKDAVCPENEVGEVYNDAIYQRNKLVESTYNVTLSPYYVDGAWDSREEYLGLMRSSVMADDGAWELIDGYAAVIGGGYADHLFLNLNDVEQLDLSADWWSDVSKKEMTVNDQLYGISGDISTSSWDNMYVLYFNKKILNELDLEMPYDIVKAGKWTWDKMVSMTKGVYVDVNGDGTVNPEDRFGMIINDELANDNFRVASDISYADHNEDGSLTFNMLTDKIVELYDKLYAYIYDSGDVLNAFKNYTGPAVVDLFSSDGALFMTYWLGVSSNLRSMDTDFGIIPYPKWDEAQENYLTLSRDGRSVWLIPSDTKDVDFAGTITEALCIGGNQIIIPVYKDKVLKGKNARDNESGEMIDIIRNGMKMDIVLENAVNMNQAGWFFRFAMALKEPLVSYYQKNEKNYTSGFENFIKNSYYSEE